MEAVEWMDVQAMKTGRKPRDRAEIDRLLNARIAAANTTVDKHTFLALQSIVNDFEGLSDVTSLAKKVDDLGRDKAIRAALKSDLDEDRREEGILRDVASLTEQLGSDNASKRCGASPAVERAVSQAKSANDSPDRQLARRVLAALSADAATKDRTT